MRSGGCANVRKYLPVTLKNAFWVAIQDAADWVPRWVAEHEQGLRVVGGRGQQPVVIGVTADDTMQHDDAAVAHRRSGGDVQSGGGRDRSSRLAGQALRPGCRTCRRVRGWWPRPRRVGAVRADLAGAAADLQDGGAVDADAGQEVDDALLGGIQATTPVATRLVGGEAGPEHLVFRTPGVGQERAGRPLILSHSTESTPAAAAVTKTTEPVNDTLRGPGDSPTRRNGRRPSPRSRVGVAMTTAMGGGHANAGAAQPRELVCRRVQVLLPERADVDISTAPGDPRHVNDPRSPTSELGTARSWACSLRLGGEFDLAAADDVAHTAEFICSPCRDHRDFIWPNESPHVELSNPAAVLGGTAWPRI